MVKQLVVLTKCMLHYSERGLWHDVMESQGKYFHVADCTIPDVEWLHNR